MSEPSKKDISSVAVDVKDLAAQNSFLYITQENAVHVIPVNSITGMETEIEYYSVGMSLKRCAFTIHYAGKRLSLTANKITDLHLMIEKILSVFGACRPLLKVEI